MSSYQRGGQQAAPNRELVQKLSNELNRESTRRYMSELIPAAMNTPAFQKRLSKIAVTVFSRTKMLWQCSTESVIRSVIEASSLGLEPGTGSMAQAYLVPRGDTCILIVSAQGLMELARRTGEIAMIQAELVHAKDKFLLRHGFDPDFEHEPFVPRKYLGENDSTPAGEFIGAYCMVTFKDGTRQVHFMRKDKIDQRRNASTAKSGPWAQWYEEMALKTVIKNASKMWPKTPQMKERLERVEAFDGEGFASPIVEEATQAKRPAPSRSAQLVSKIASYGQDDGGQEEEPDIAEPAAIQSDIPPPPPAEDAEIKVTPLEPPPPEEMPWDKYQSG